MKESTFKKYTHTQTPKKETHSYPCFTMKSLNKENKQNILRVSSNNERSCVKNISESERISCSLRRSETLNRQTVLLKIASKTIENENVPSKLRIARHIIGFRSYNRAHKIECDLKKTIITVAMLINSPFTGLTDALVLAEIELEKMHTIEIKFYGVADKITKYEEKLREIEFLKRNIDKCISTSVASVMQELKKVSESYAGTENHSTSESMLNKVDNIIEQSWRGYTQLRSLIDYLKMYGFSSESTGTMNQELTAPQQAEIKQLLRESNEYLKKKNAESKISQIITASVDEEEMTRLFRKLGLYESQLSISLRMKQATASVLVDFSLEAKYTSQILSSRTKQIEAALKSGKSMSEIVSEEKALMEFVKSGKQYEDEAKKRDNEKAPLHTQRQFMQASPNTSPNIPSPGPVWAQTWDSNTKVLKKRNK